MLTIHIRPILVAHEHFTVALEPMLGHACYIRPERTREHSVEPTIGAFVEWRDEHEREQLQEVNGETDGDEEEKEKDEIEESEPFRNQTKHLSLSLFICCCFSL